MTKQRYTTMVALFAVFVLCPVKSVAQNSPPIADAGLSRYAAQDPIVLDGTGSYDPDNSGILSYTWRQIAGPPVVIIDANTATPTIAGSIQTGTGRGGLPTLPTIGGFTQTDAIQECEFELVVSDGELTSLLDTVKVIIVPDFGEDRFELQNYAFDPRKPTLAYFGGGDCTYGTVGYSMCPIASSEWLSRANVISYPGGYGPDTRYESMRTYYHLGDMIIVYLSSMAPNYKQPIQTVGWSTGAQPAIDVGIRLNRVYQDARYAVNRVTHLDGGCRILESYGGSWGKYTQVVESFLNSSVDGEQCWVDHYWGVLGQGQIPKANIMAVDLSGFSHSGMRDWYGSSLIVTDTNRFNHGVVAGAYWSVVGPGRNLQFTKQSAIHYFRWDGTRTNGNMSFVNEELYPGRLPEPVTLVGPLDVGDPNGAILTCEESENAVGYQLLFGADPHRVMHYTVVSDTPEPPNAVIIELPFDNTWWTVRVRDQYGSTIYADPMRINSLILSLPIENMTTGRQYGYIQDAINDAELGDKIVVGEGIYQENIDFKGKNLTVRSTDPNDPAIVAATVINGGDKDSAVTFPNAEDANCVLAGFTITDANNGIYCSGASPTITNCSIAGNAGAGIELWGSNPTITGCTIADNAGAGIELYYGSNPTITNCCITANAGSGIEMLVYKSGRVTISNYPIIKNCTIAGNLQHGISEGIPTITNSIIWANSPQQIADTQGSVTYSNIQGGWLGEGNIDADPLFADPDNGDYHLKSQAGRWDRNSQTWVIDEVTSPCIDAGDLGTSVGLEPLPNGGIINMGAYGGTAEASKSPAN